MVYFVICIGISTLAAIILLLFKKNWALFFTKEPPVLELVQYLLPLSVIGMYPYIYNSNI